MEEFPILKMPKDRELVKLPNTLYNILDEFVAEYRTEPDFFVRVPGRVNLIGEHIDYCGYGVCPMAIQQNIFAAVKVTEDSDLLKLANFEGSKFKKFQCSLLNFEILRDEKVGPSWENYFLCGVKGILESMEKPSGMCVVVFGDIPPGAGLSSSSALVCAAALATAYANKLKISKLELAALCARAEHHIGTQGGGMDQAIAFLASAGSAKFIEFEPTLKVQDVQLPAMANFVIIQSLVTKNKAASSDFNTRVVECRLAAQVLAKQSGLEWKGIKRLAAVQDLLGIDLPNMIKLVSENLHDSPYLKSEVCKLLEVDEQELNSVSLTENTLGVQEFKLKQRAMHVFSEALRVKQFISTNKLEDAGKLMNESHESLRDLYECSHPQLDKLVDLCWKSGALGARLTGAGWGGCVVALVTVDKVVEFIEKIKKTYFLNTMNCDENLDSLIFSSKPTHGARILVLV
nr:PREDICTED: N-acetylgalactosamine kinase [Bemisia tabaci]XP_018904771.1 PREDICTED: N-acetylgalactosamine kinase [Bemisia tabaci]